MTGSKQVSTNLENIFKNLFNISIDKMGDDIRDRHLITSKLHLTPMDLVCLYMEIEKAFNISIPEKYIVENKFNTINNIENIINQQLGNN